MYFQGVWLFASILFLNFYNVYYYDYRNETLQQYEAALLLFTTIFSTITFLSSFIIVSSSILFVPL
jgi:hypothetical protein